jgi:cytochrome bd-type quinol oxidase subunit 2
MVRWISREVPSWLTVCLAMVIVVGVAVAVQGLARRRFPRLSEGDHNEVAGYLIAVVGVLYAVIAGFLMIAVWEDLGEARRGVAVEAAALGDVVEAASAFDPALYEELRTLTVAYTDELVEVEWPAMQTGDHSERADDLLLELRSLVTSTVLDGTNQELVLAQQLADLDTADDLRRERLISNQDGLPGPLWFVLAMGGAITVGFALLFGLRDRRMHFVLVGSTSAMIALTITVVALLDYPFVGDVAVSPVGFEELRADLSSSP